MQKILYSLNNCMVKVIENGVVADLRKTVTFIWSIVQTTHGEIKIFSTFLDEDGELPLKVQVSKDILAFS